MKKFTDLIKEHSFTSDRNPGNGILGNGVANHYTPIQNIITNVKNLFAVHLGVVVGLGEDQVSLKLHSSKFVDEESIYKVIHEPLFNDYKTLDSYIREQGLTKVTMVNLGMYYVVYYSPADIVQATNPLAQEPNAVGATCNTCGGCDSCCPCPCEAKEALYDEFEMATILKESEEDEEEMKDVTLEKILELVDSKDKVKAAKQLELLVSQQMELPREYYFAAIKFKSGDEAIALRWKYEKKLPTGQSSQCVRSLIHIFGTGDKAIWVQDFSEDSLVQLPEEVKKLVENVLNLLEASETDDPAIYKLTGERKERKDNKKEDDDSKDKEDSEEDKKEDKSGDDDDTEDDDSRGDDDN